MARGFLSGAIWGTVLSVAGLGTLSVIDHNQTSELEQLADDIRALPQPTEMGQEDVAVPDSEAAERPDPVQTTTTPAPEPVVENAITRDTEQDTPAPVDADAVPEVAAAPAETAPVETAPDAPTTDEKTPAEQPTEAASDTPVEIVPDRSTSGRRPVEVAVVAPNADAPALARPPERADDAPDDVDAVPTPVPDTSDSVAALDVPAVPDAVTVQAGDAADATPSVSAAPTLTTPTGEVGLSVSTEPAQPPIPAIPAIETPLSPAVDAEPDAPESTAPAEEAVTDTPDPAPARPRVRQLVPDLQDDADAPSGAETAALARPRIGRPAASLADRNTQTSRLPTIGSAASTDPTPDETPAVADARPPLEQFAASIDAVPGLPKMSIVLIDDGSGPLGPDTLDNFPFPVTFALDPGQPGAADRMAAYRALGYEVATLVAIPDGAQPSDVEQILAGSVAAVPEAVALIEAPGSGLQSTRSNTEQVAKFAADSGHGLIFLPNGLNTAQAIAARDNVPALSILRDFDGDGQDARTKRRFLDGAAFRARQDGGAVMLGRLTPDTVSALVLWGLQDRASSVALVPVSMLLREGQN